MQEPNITPAPSQWLTPYRPRQTDRMLYDGECGLCHRAVNFTLKHDTSGTAFRYSPLQSERIDDFLPSGVTGDALPDSVVVVTEQDEVLTKSSAILYMGMRLGGQWRALAMLGYLFPQRLRDGVYDWIARIRHRLFAKPKQACPMIPPDLRDRFEF